MTSKEKTLTVVSVVLALLFFGLAVALCKVSYENRRLNAILDLSCSYATDTATCRQGVKILKDMSVEEIENFNPTKYRF